MVLVSRQHSGLTHGRLLAELSEGLLASRAVVHAEVARSLAELRVRPHTILRPIVVLNKLALRRRS